MRKILVIGIGAGDPDLLTIQAIKALNQVDVFFIPDKGDEKAALRELRTTICERFIENADYRTVGVDIPQRASSGPDYLASVDQWHSDLADIYARLFEQVCQQQLRLQPGRVHTLFGQELSAALNGFKNRHADKGKRCGPRSKPKRGWKRLLGPVLRLRVVRRWFRVPATPSTRIGLRVSRAGRGLRPRQFRTATINWRGIQ